MRKLKAADCMENLPFRLPFLCLMPVLWIPCCLCGEVVKSIALCNPPDARKITEEEAKPYIDGLQGGWQIFSSG